MPYDRILGFDAQLLFGMAVTIINLVLLVALLAYFFYNPVKKFLENRSERVANTLDSANKKLESAEESKLSYEQKLKEIELERAEILETAKRLAKDTGVKIIQEARAEADSIKKRAFLEIEREEEKARDDMKTQIIEISTLMANRFIKNSMDAATQNKLLEEAIADLGDVKWNN